MNLSLPPDRTAAKGFGESPQEPLRQYLADWSRWELDRVEPAAIALHAYGQALDARLDERALMLQRLERRFAELQHQACEELAPVLGAGLEARRGRFVRPLAMGTPEAARDWLAWGHLSAWLRLLGVDGTRHLCVCEACTVVFAPSGRKRFARCCEAHKDHPITAQPLGVWNRPPARRGEKIQIPVPELYPDSLIVRTIRDVTLGRCLECGDLFHGRADKTFCDDDEKACRQKYHRRGS